MDDHVAGGPAVPTVLIADDDVDHRELISIALRRLGHDVVEAADSDEAMRAVSAGGLDAILLDVRMPGESGIELCRRLRRDPATAAVPIMFVSADVNDNRILDALRAGADDYLTKPFHRAEFGIRLENLLRPRAGHAAGSATATNAALLAAHNAVVRPLAFRTPARRSA
jgi:DNA-binding response OmpR family regulator